MIRSLLGGWTGVLGLAGILAFVATFVFSFSENARLSEELTAARRVISADAACLSAVKRTKGARSVPDVCDGAIARVVRDSERLSACDRAAAADDRFALNQACPAGILKLLAERDAARGDVTWQREQYQRTRAGQSEAIARAEARATELARRKANAEAARKAAPRDSDGLAVCDAECLRQRYEAAR